MIRYMQRLMTRSTVSSREYWTFRKHSNKKFTHGLHQYPARMHPEIAKQIIAKFSPNKKTLVIDPYLGSAGVLIEAMFHGNNSIGFDINPLAILLSKVKTTIVNPQSVKIEYAKILEKSKNDYYKDKIYAKEIPQQFNIEFWYKPNVVKKLSILKHHINRSDSNDNVKNFLKICFSLTVRKASNQRKNEFKIYRISKDELRNFRPDTFEIFESVCRRNCELISDFKSKMKDNPAKAIVKYGNAINLENNFNKIKSSVVENAKGHLVITSPPYGDHDTTVAYGQYSFHQGLWLDLPEKRLREVDRISLGGQQVKEDEVVDLGSVKLNSQLKEIKKIDQKRALDVYSFFFDFDKCLEGLSSILKNKSHLCFVVANRRVKRIPIRTDQILVELAKNHKFKHIDTLSRNIPTKVIPYRNAPENITNHVGNTMNEEKIIILKN